jgi:hypothetical protein
MRGIHRLAAAALVTSGFAFVTPAAAVYETDRYKAQAEISMQSTFQSDGTSSWEYVQQRQEVALGLVYKIIPTSMDGFFRKIDFSILWRGRYDAIFDIRDRYRRRGFDERPDFVFPEGDRPRELYFDFEFNGALQPLSLRIGKQQVVWGEADFFRSLDVINPLRIDQMSLVGDDLDDYREPLWIAKALWHVGGIIPGVTSADIEMFYSPDGRPLTNKLIFGNGWRIFDNFDCYPDRIDCDRPHDIGFARRRHPWELSSVSSDHNHAPDQGDLGIENIINAVGIDLSTGEGGATGGADFIYLGNQRHGDRVNLYGDGHHEIDPKRRSMAGIRFMGQTSTGGIYFTLNYIWKRVEIPAPGIGWDTLFTPDAPFLDANIAAEAAANLLSPDLNGDGVPDGNAAALRDCLENSTPKLILGPITSPTAEAPLGRSAYGYAFPTESVGAACVPIPLHYPHTHIIGGTLTYNDYDYTGAILRMEQSLSTKEPRALFPALAGTRAGTFPNQRDYDTGGWETMQLWRSMVGFDYLAAVFQHRSLPKFIYNQSLLRSLLVDQWFFTFQFFNEYWANVDSQLGQDFSLTNRHQHWNPILTWIMTGFFDKSRLRPTVAYAHDVNQAFNVLWLQAQYYVLPQLQIRLGTVLYLGSEMDETFLYLHKYANRDSHYLRLTYFLL